MKAKNILKSTLAVVAVTASSFGAWKAYGTYGSVNNSLLMENLEALTLDDENLKKGNLVTCYGPSEYKYPEIRIGSFEYYVHIPGLALETKDGWIYYDELIETDYEICTAKGNGNLKGNNSDYRTKDTSKGQVECAIECSQTKDGILNAILQDAWNNSTPVY